MKAVVVSGYFDPIHEGHIEYLKAARRLGDCLIVIVNNDKQARLKKGKSFESQETRMAIVKELKSVDMAVLSLDKTRSVARTLRAFCEVVGPVDILANGGDVTSIPEEEQAICEEYKIKVVYGVGGEKINSSSWITGSEGKE